MMTKTGMLIVTNPNKFIRYVPRLQREIQKTLYIQILPQSRLKFVEKPSSGIDKYFGPFFSSSVKNLYRNSITAKSLDVRVLLSRLRNPKLDKIMTRQPIEIVYFDQCLNKDEMNGFLINCIENRTSNCQVVSLEEAADNFKFDSLQSDSFGMFDNVVLGGTFDRLHCGHKALLSEAVLACNKKLTVGVTNTDMLKTKKLWELIEPCETRMERVQEFLEDVDPHLNYNIVPIGDMYGPTKDDPTFEVLVVSAETLKGSQMVNEVRVKNVLKPLLVRSVELLPDEKLDEIEEDKISSSNDRLRLLGTRLKQPQEQTNLAKWPYVIGLTGGIGSGKTSISKRLLTKGAGVVNCDQLGHQVYNKNEPGYNLILANFGDSVLSPTGDIDRKKLGGIVFSDKEKLRLLNNLIWPAIYEKVKESVCDLYKEGKEVIVVEAALLLEAGWEKLCHEVWACIIPPNEAIKRLKERSGLSEEEACSRITAQLSNTQYVNKAEVVLCTLWHPDYTQKQVDRAWSQLLQHLLTR